MSRALDAALRAVRQNYVSMPLKPTAEMIEAASRHAKLSPAQIVALYNAMVQAAQESGQTHDSSEGSENGNS